jgi:hypothetical protein
VIGFSLEFNSTATPNTAVVRDGSSGAGFAVVNASFVNSSGGFVGPYFATDASPRAGSGLIRGQVSQVLVAARDDGDSLDASCLSWGVDGTDVLAVGDFAVVANVNIDTKPSGFVLLNTANLALFGYSDFGSGGGVIYVKNATTPPTANPDDGGYLFVQGGALKYRGSSGTITTIAPA